VSKDLTKPDTGDKPAAVAASAAPASSSAPTTSAEDPNAFSPVGNEKPTQSGEALLVEAYAVIWLIAMAFVVIAWRRTRLLESKIQSLEVAIDRANLTGTPSTKRSVGSDPGVAPASKKS